MVKVRNQHISAGISLIISLLFLVNLSVFMWPTVGVHASSQNISVTQIQPKLSFQKDLDLLIGQSNQSVDSDDSSDDNDYFGLANNNPPEPTNPCYREYQLEKLDQRVIEVPLKVGRSLKGDAINLPNLSDNDLRELDITIASNSNLNKDDLAAPLTFNYSSNGGYLSINLNDSGLDKTNGAGTQLRLNLKSQDGKRSDTAIIGIWRNYVEHPYFELNVGNGLYLQYMLNNDNRYEGKANTSLSSDKAIPNYCFRDATQGDRIVNTMYYSYDTNYDPSAWSNNVLIIGNGDPANGYNVYDSDKILKAKNHLCVRSDPNHPKKIIFQFDTTPKINGQNLHLRFFASLEPSSNKQEVIFKQRFINYTSDDNSDPVTIPAIWIYQKYDTKLNDHDDVPIYLSKISSLNNLPDGLYFKNTDNPDDPYRLDFIYNETGGPQGWDAFRWNQNISDFVGKNKTGYKADQKIYPLINDLSPDSAIGMIWSPSQLGSIKFGNSSMIMNYNVTSSMSLAPVVRNDKDKLRYEHDRDTESFLPPLELNGTVNSTNREVKEINLYYLIDSTQVPADVSQRKSLGTIKIGKNEHTADSQIAFKKAITDTEDLKTLADLNNSGHILYIYGIDNKGYQSHLEKIKILPNAKLKLHHINELGQQIIDDKYLIGAKGDEYDLNNSNYLPNSIVTKDAKYRLADASENPNLKGVFGEDPSTINIKYQKNGTMAITKVPQLNFGHVILPSTNDSLLPISEQKNSLEITDSSGYPIKWKLLMSSTPFYLENSTTNKFNYLLKYRVTNNDIKTITETPQEVSRYSNLPSNASTKKGETVITDFKKIWWSLTDPTNQIAGPMLQVPAKFETKDGQYHCTVTWSLENTLN